MALVLDTNIFSYLFKQDTRAAKYLPHLANHILILSFMTVAELDLWAVAHNWGVPRQQKLETYLRRYLIQHSTRELGQAWAQAMSSASRKGRPIMAADAWVAATALHFGIPLVTHNPNDFVGVEGLTIITEK